MDQSDIPVDNYDILVDDRQFFTIRTLFALEINEHYDITITYTGVLNDEIYGFFRSGYLDENGEQQ